MYSEIARNKILFFFTFFRLLPLFYCCDYLLLFHLEIVYYDMHAYYTIYRLASLRLHVYTYIYSTKATINIELNQIIAMSMNFVRFYYIFVVITKQFDIMNAVNQNKHMHEYAQHQQYFYRFKSYKIETNPKFCGH